MPSQRAKLRTTVNSAGSQTSSTTTAAGMPSIRLTTTRSRPENRLTLRTRPPRTGPSAVRRRAGRAGVGLVTLIWLAPYPRPSAGEDGLLLLLEALRQTVDVVRVLDEALEGRDGHRRGEVRPGVAVEELRDVFRLADQLRRLLLQGRVHARVGLGVRGDKGQLRGRHGGRQRVGRGEVLQERLGGGLVLRLGRHAVAVDGRVDGVRSDRGVDLWEGEEVDVLALVHRELLVHEGPEQEHAALLLLQRLCRLLPDAAEGVRLVVRQQRPPGVEDLLHLGRVPGLLALHQVDVELVTVDPQVEGVERAERRPAVLVGEGDRDQPVLLHLLGESRHLVERLRRLVALLLPHGLAVEDRPRVVRHRHEVLLAVLARGRLLERVRDPVDRPDVTDVADQAAAGEELHPVAGEPAEDVVRAALQVVVDVLLEGIVVDRVDLHLHALLLGEVGRLRLILLGERGAALVRAPGHGAARLAAAAATAGAAATAPAAAGGQAGRRRQSERSAEQR